LKQFTNKSVKKFECEVKQHFEDYALKDANERMTIIFRAKK